MTRQHFSADDIDTLVEALEAWENKSDVGEFMGDLLGAMLCKDDPVAKAKMETERRDRMQKADREKRRRKERSVVLRAKLIDFRNAAAVEALESAVTVGAVDRAV